MNPPFLRLAFTKNRFSNLFKLIKLLKGWIKSKKTYLDFIFFFFFSEKEEEVNYEGTPNREDWGYV